MNLLKRRKTGNYTLGADLMAGAISSQHGALLRAAGVPDGPFSGKLPLNAVTFTVPFTSTTNVSGGGAALQAAITAAAVGEKIVITDSLAYDPVVFTGKTNVSVEAAAGQTPTITAVGVGGACVLIQAGCSGISLKGLHFIGNGNINTLSAPNNGLIQGNTTVSGMATFDRLIVEECVFTELVPASGVPGIQLIGTNGTVHTNVWVHKCTFTDMCTPAFTTGVGYGAVTVGGFGSVWVQNCKIARVAVARASSSMRGVVLKNLGSIVEGVLCDDIGSAGSNECFKHNDEASFGTAVGVSSWNQNVAYNCKRGFRLSLPGGEMRVNHGVIYIDTAGIAAGNVLCRVDGVPIQFRVENTVIQSAGDGTAFSAANVTENNNDVFNVGAPGKVLDPTDIAFNSIPVDVPGRNFTSGDPNVQNGGTIPGEFIGAWYSTGESLIWVTPFP